MKAKIDVSLFEEKVVEKIVKVVEVVEKIVVKIEEKVVEKIVDFCWNDSLPKSELTFSNNGMTV